VKAFNFRSFVNWLNEKAVLYCVPWGYEKLPEEPSGGDVDMYVHPHVFRKVADELKRRGYTASNCPHYHEKHHHTYFSRTDCFTIDLFDSFSYSHKGKTHLLMIPPKFILEGRFFWNAMCVASPIVELLFTALRVIGGRTDCMKRLEKYIVTL